MEATNVHSTIDFYLWPNRYLLTFLGFWPSEPSVTSLLRVFACFRVIFSIFVMLSLFIPEILMIIVNWGNISVLTEVGCITVAVTQLTFKLLYMVACQRQFYCIYQSVTELWMITYNMEGRENYESFALQAKRITLVFCIAGFSNVFTLGATSVIIWVNNYIHANGTYYARQLPFDIWYGIDIQATPNFEVIFCFQMLGTVYGVAGGVGFDSTMMSFILQICGQFSLLRARLSAIGSRIRENTYSKVHCGNRIIRPWMEIKQCIEHHLHTIRVAKELNALLSPVIFIQLMTGGVEICLSGFALIVGTEGSNRIDMMKFAVYLVTIYLQLGLWCWPGELLIQESTGVGDAIYYELPWYMMSVEQRRDLSFIIFRARKECQVTALSFQVMSLRKLTEVFNTAASYFALLRSVSEKEAD